MLTPLRHLRLRLTLWYAGTFGAILILLGGGLFVTIRHQFARRAVRELAEDTGTLIRRVRATPSIRLDSATLRVAGGVRRSRRTMLFDTAGTPLVPAATQAWIADAARRAAHDSVVNVERDGPHGTTLRLRAERFALADGSERVAVLVDRTVELEDRYAGLLVAFGGAAVASLLLVAVGGWILVRQSSAPVERALEQQRRFVADAAHELRTPVTVLRNRAEVALQQDRSPAAYRDALAVVARESGHLAHIVEALFTLARADAGETPPRFSRVFLDDIAVDAARSAAVLGRTRGVAVEVTEYEEAPVSGDPTLLRQLAMVLLDNAVKFTPAGGRVTVRVHATDGRAELVVADTGIGIAAEDLPHVYDRFFRVDAARSRRDSKDGMSGGAGLGLSIAQWILKLHRGTIRMTSEPGRSTTVTVWLPHAAAVSPEPGAGDVPHVGSSPGGDD